LTPDLGCGALATVIVAHRDCHETLERAVTSVLAQTLQPVSVVVVDDDSRNGERLSATVSRFADSRVRVLATSRNVGQFRIYSRLLPFVSSPFIAFQDADDWSLPHRLERLADEMERRGYDIAGSYLARVLPSGEPLPMLTPPIDVNRALARRCRGGVVFGATTMARTDFLSRLGGFDGTAQFGADTELVYRAVFAGRVGNVPEPLYVATVRRDSLTASPETGFGSPARRRYRRRIRRAFYRNAVRRRLSCLRPEELAARPPDVLFDLVALS
jgi:glycosyltransferase involved in cell wall biosynthesis